MAGSGGFDIFRPARDDPVTGTGRGEARLTDWVTLLTEKVRPFRWGGEATFKNSQKLIGISSCTLLAKVTLAPNEN